MKKTLYIVLGLLLAVNFAWAGSFAVVEFGHFDVNGGPLGADGKQLRPFADGARGEVYAVPEGGDAPERIAAFTVNGSELFGLRGFFLSDWLVIDPEGIVGIFLRIREGEENEGGVYWESPTVALNKSRQQISFASDEWTRHQEAAEASPDNSSASGIREFALHANYPNPFNGATTLVFDVPQASRVKLLVYNLLGREVAQLADARFETGQYRLRFDGANLASGIYLLRMDTESGFSAVRRLTLLK
jgi:hypothetical protein